MKPTLMLTCDYELFGNGDGCLRNCVLDPAERMVSVAEEYGARITFYVEVCEFAAMQRAEEIGQSTRKCQNGVKRVINQLREFLERGHDVQLHVHPQWHGINYDESSWNLNYEAWRIGGLDARLGVGRTFDVIREGKDWLESHMQCVIPSYKVLSFRAGGLCVQPSEAVVAAMRATGIGIDSSVAPGLAANDGRTEFNFMSVPSEVCRGYRFSECVDMPDMKGDLIELPIATASKSWLRSVVPKVGGHLPKPVPTRPAGCSGKARVSSSAPRTWSSIRPGLRKVAMLDYSRHPSKTLRWVMRNILSSSYSEGFGVITAISHTKNFGAPDEMKKFIDWVVRFQQNHVQLDILNNPTVLSRLHSIISPIM